MKRYDDILRELIAECNNCVKTIRGKKVIMKEDIILKITEIMTIDNNTANDLLEDTITHYEERQHIAVLSTDWAK